MDGELDERALRVASHSETLGKQGTILTAELLRHSFCHVLSEKVVNYDLRCRYCRHNRGLLDN